jgi:hypothetical protein
VFAHPTLHLQIQQLHLHFITTEQAERVHLEIASTNSVSSSCTHHFCDSRSLITTITPLSLLRATTDFLFFGGMFLKQNISHIESHLKITICAQRTTPQNTTPSSINTVNTPVCVYAPFILGVHRGIRIRNSDADLLVCVRLPKFVMEVA